MRYGAGWQASQPVQHVTPLFMRGWNVSAPVRIPWPARSVPAPPARLSATSIYRPWSANINQTYSFDGSLYSTPSSVHHAAICRSPFPVKVSEAGVHVGARGAQQARYVLNAHSMQKEYGMFAEFK